MRVKRLGVERRPVTDNESENRVRSESKSVEIRVFFVEDQIHIYRRTIHSLALEDLNFTFIYVT